jgi:hypothetical protein
MSTPALTPAAPAISTPRPGSRAARLRLPRAIDALKNLALEYGVCIRPVTLRRTELVTGETELIDLPCGATREDKCPSCAKKAKRLRQRQIREGWHRTDEPNPGPDPATEEQKTLIRLRRTSSTAGPTPSDTAAGTRSPTWTPRSKRWRR